jgi:hypothetical protein
VAASFSYPTYIALDSSGTMGYVVEEGTGGTAFAPWCSLRAVTTLAGSGTAGFADNTNGLLAQFNIPPLQCGTAVVCCTWQTG